MGSVREAIRANLRIDSRESGHLRSQPLSASARGMCNLVVVHVVIHALLSFASTWHKKKASVATSSAKIQNPSSEPPNTPSILSRNQNTDKVRNIDKKRKIYIYIYKLWCYYLGQVWPFEVLLSGPSLLFTKHCLSKKTL